MQQKIIDLGVDPANAKPVKDFLKEKDIEIQILKKKLKIPNTQHIESPELVSLQAERDKYYKEMLMYHNIKILLWH